MFWCSTDARAQQAIADRQQKIAKQMYERFNMTRQHAHELVFGKCKTWEGKEVSNFLDALEALGLLKFEEEHTYDTRSLTFSSHTPCVYQAIAQLECFGYKIDKPKD